eukprot:TRINITY_DN4893_c0_g1_i3.p1 TRINITY_DN4893_c0_g1~~TRINITY_DN4893_c0_g1_i3.p1  ORF type:complete len:350 (+),score=50.76 TRINITY_DN4893_c0_g1_i3:75-1124(+)
MMLNLGGPGTQGEVRPFLERLFTDREILKLPFQEQTGRFIAFRRSPGVAAQYALIGGGSPIRKFTEQQGKLMIDLLDKKSPETAPHKFYIGFRYADPLTQDTLLQMKADGVKRAIAFSQYPQYSCSTTGSSLNELYRQLLKLNMLDTFNWSVIDRWPTHSGLIQSFVNLVKEGLEKFSPEARKDVVLLFSAHSLPLKVVNRGDPYPAEVAASVYKVMEGLGFSNPYRLVWQSKVGPLPWLEPSTEKAVHGLANIGTKNVLFVPIVFTSDHIETLYEIDMLYIPAAQKLGLVAHRAKSLNVEPFFIETLADIVQEHLKSGLKYSHTQLKQRCPLCTNEWCATSKQYFCDL